MQHHRKLSLPLITDGASSQPVTPATDVRPINHSTTKKAFSDPPKQKHRTFKGKQAELARLLEVSGTNPSFIKCISDPVIKGPYSSPPLKKMHVTDAGVQLGSTPPQGRVHEKVIIRR